MSDTTRIILSYVWFKDICSWMVFSVDADGRAEKAAWFPKEYEARQYAAHMNETATSPMTDIPTPPTKQEEGE